jgi:hypothetical protein
VLLREILFPRRTVFPEKSPPPSLTIRANPANCSGVFIVNSVSAIKYQLASAL